MRVVDPREADAAGECNWSSYKQRERCEDGYHVKKKVRAKGAEKERCQRGARRRVNAGERRGIDALVRSAPEQAMQNSMPPPIPRSHGTLRHPITATFPGRKRLRVHCLDPDVDE
jgi:hypothetical protein